MEEQAKLKTPLPHFDLSLAQGADAEQRRVRLHLLKITANGDGLTKRSAVVQDQNRNALKRIERRETLGALFELGQVDLDDWHDHLLFGEENAHPAWVGRAHRIVELHDRRPSRLGYPLFTGPY